MKIGIDVRPAIHKSAGIGSLTLNLMNQMLVLDRENEYYLYSDKEFDVGVSQTNVHSVVKSFGDSAFGKLLWHGFGAVDARHTRRLDRFISVGSLQIAALTKNLAVLIIPDLSHVLFPELHVAKSRLTARMLMTRALTTARTIIAISEHTKKDILLHMNGRISETKVLVAHIAAEDVYATPPSQSDVQCVKDRYHLRNKYILSVGTLEPRKNLISLIRAFATIAREGDPRDLVIVGRQGWMYEAIHAEAESSGFVSRIKFLGFVPLNDMPAVYGMADLFVYPSFYEGFGIPPLEAMRCGVPVITSNVASLPEVTGAAAVLIDPHNLDELTFQMKRLLGDAQLRMSYAQAGKERALRFSWRSFAERVRSALDR